MSGMEPLAALGLASNVMQMISFGHEVATTYSQLKRSGMPDPNLSSNTEKLVELITRLETSLTQTSGKEASAEEKRLESLATKCLEAGKSLNTELERLAIDTKKPRRRDIVGRAVQSIWRRGKIDDLERDLKRCAETLSLGLLMRIWSVNDPVPGSIN
jgi:hypothetical protein